MRKLFLFAVAGICMATSSFAGIYISEGNAGECGYRYVSELHEGGTDYLSCHDPGYCDCRFNGKLSQVMPTSEPNLDEVNNEIKNISTTIRQNISTGETHGTFVSSLGNVTWSSSGNEIQYSID